MFDGGSFGNRVDLGGKSKRAATDRKQFLKQQQKEREVRQEKAKQLLAAEKIKKALRSYCILEKQKKAERSLFEKRFGDMQKVLHNPQAMQNENMKKAILLGLQKKLLPSFLFFFQGRKDIGLLEQLLETVVATMAPPVMDGAGAAVTPTSTSSTWRIFQRDPTEQQTQTPLSSSQQQQLLEEDQLLLLRWCKLLFLFLRYLHDRGNKNQQKQIGSISSSSSSTTTRKNYGREILSILENVNSEQFRARMALHPAIFHFLRDVTSAKLLITNPMVKAKDVKVRLLAVWKKFSPLTVGEFREKETWMIEESVVSSTFSTGAGGSSNFDFHMEDRDGGTTLLNSNSNSDAGALTGEVVVPMVGTTTGASSSSSAEEDAHMADAANADVGHDSSANPSTMVSSSRNSAAAAFRNFQTHPGVYYHFSPSGSTSGTGRIGAAKGGVTSAQPTTNLRSNKSRNDQQHFFIACEFLFSFLLSKGLLYEHSEACFWFSEQMRVLQELFLLQSKFALREYLLFYIAYSFSADETHIYPPLLYSPEGDSSSSSRNNRAGFIHASVNTGRTTGVSTSAGASASSSNKRGRAVNSNASTGGPYSAEVQHKLLAQIVQVSRNTALISWREKEQAKQDNFNLQSHLQGSSSSTASAGVPRPRTSSIDTNVDAKYLSGLTKQLDVQRSQIRLQARRAIHAMGKSRNVTSDHPKVVLLSATGNLWSALKYGLLDGGGGNSTAGPTTGSSSAHQQHKNFSSFDRSFFDLLDLFSLLSDPEYDKERLKLEDYLDTELRNQLMIKEQSNLIRLLSEKCKLDDFLLCYFGSDFTEPPHDSVLSTLAFACKNFLSLLTEKVLAKSAEQWARELVDKCVNGGDTTSSGTTSGGANLYHFGIATSSGAGGSSSSSSSANNYRAFGAEADGGASSSSHNGLYIVPFACVFNVQATVVDDIEFFSPTKNPIAEKLPVIAQLINRFAFVFLQHIDSLNVTYNLNLLGPNVHDYHGTRGGRTSATTSDDEDLSRSEDADSDIEMSDAAIGTSSPLFASGLQSSHHHPDHAGGSSSPLLSGSASAFGAATIAGAGGATSSTSNMNNKPSRDDSPNDSGPAVDKFGFTSFTGGNGEEGNARNKIRFPQLLQLVRHRVCGLARSLYDKFRRRQDLFSSSSTSSTSSASAMRTGTTTSAASTSTSSVVNIGTSNKIDWTIAFSGTRRSNLVLTELPHCIPFQDRVQFLQEWIRIDHDMRQAARNPFQQMMGTRKNIRRTHIVEDGYDAFATMDEEQLRGAFRVVFIDENGEQESGIDGGGLFKEFLLELSRSAFSPERGLFRETTDGERKLVPRSLIDTTMVYESERMSLSMFHFLGKVVGKAIYENCLLEPQFSRVFLNLLLGRDNTIDDLYALDRDFARNLSLTKESTVTEDWGLFFCIEGSEMGGKQFTHDLKPNGRNIAVTEENKINYIQRLAFYKTTTELQKQSVAFRDGMLRVLDKHWLKMFDPYELNFLISGTPDLKFDELKACCTYAGGYTQNSECITWFWQILLHEFSVEQKSKFLQFVTSCSRAPLLGYSSLYPPFCIHRVPDNERLPTASTCANLLKLPDYSDKARLAEKLIQAIYQGEGGFHLS
ncbi:unnamed protein product [Amoebophrya sp. A120]|nr:unnamed protein product [Amoebophrya sp. A120]|eukprot:GSA120T00019648001.1